MDSNNPLSRAQNLLASALQLLDEADAPSDIGAHVNLAITRLSETLEAAGQNDQYETTLRKMSRGSDANN
jgi:hypothetical protein